MAFENDTKVVIRGDGSSAQNAFRQVGESAGRLAVGLQSVTATATAMFGVIAGAGFVVAARNAIDYQDAASDAAQVTGLTAEAFSTLAYAAKFGNLSTESLTKAVVKLSAAMVDVTRGDEKMSALFGKTLNISVRDAAGALRSADDVMLDVAERISGMQDGAKKTAVAIELFGEKAGPALIPFLNQGREGIEQLRKEAVQFGLAVSTEAAESAAKLNDDLDRLRSASQGAANQIGQRLVPMLAEVAEYFVQATKDTNLWKGALITLGKVMSDIAPDMFGLSDAARARNRYAEVKDEIQRLEQVMVGLNNTMASDPGNKAAERRLSNLTTKSAELKRELLQLSAEIARLEGGAKEAGGGRGFVNPGVVGGASVDDVEMTDKSAKAGSRVPAWTNLLEQQKQVYGEAMLAQGKFMEWGAQEESRYWQGILARHDLSSEERLAVASKYYAAERALRKEAMGAELAEFEVRLEAARNDYAERERIAAEAAQFVRERYGADSKEYRDALRRQLEIARDHQEKLREITRLQLESARADEEAAVAEREAIAEMEVQLGLRTAASMLRVRREGVRARLQLELDAIDAEQAAYAAGTVEYERYEARRAEIKRRYKALDKQLERDQAVESSGTSGRVLDTGAGALGDSIDALVARGRNAGAELGSIWRRAGQQMVSEIITKPFVQWVAMWAKKLAMNAGFLATKNATEVTSAGVSIATEESVGLAAIGVSAARAAAGAYAAIAGIPVVGPVMAPIAAAAALAAVISLGKSMFSAEGGMDIGNENPIIQAHAREMVLPARYADVIRGMADGGGGGGGGGGGSVSITALDSKSFERFLRGRQGDMLLRALAARARNGQI